MDLSRTEALIGTEALKQLGALHVAVFGVGGVGSWCAEALVRSGVRHLTLVDDDVVAPSNLNRQCPAVTGNLGRLKVEEMKARLKSINPEAEIEAVATRYTGGPVAADFIVDAIDSVDCKAELILEATAAGIPIVSSMGAAKRLDPTKIEIRRFERVEGDGLARALRQRFKRIGRFPMAKFCCVVSTETPLPLAEKGSMMPVTCAFGMALAHEVIRSCAR